MLDPSVETLGDIVCLEEELVRRLTIPSGTGLDQRDAWPDGIGRANSKKDIRQMYLPRREERLRKSEEFLRTRFDKLAIFLADGSDVFPERIRVTLEEVVTGERSADLFRLASLGWSVPVSAGYGRRMRFLVWDEYAGKLMGIIALGDAVFNLRARDEWVGWTAQERKERLVGLMDAYVLGAVPPYNFLLAGKLVGCLIATREVAARFGVKYQGSKGTISGQYKQAELLGVTTTSALGRSSVYNRLKLGGRRYFERLGYTSGFGHFHVSDETFRLIRRYLALKGHPYAANHFFGGGPNWRLRAIKAGLRELGLRGEVLMHGVAREVYFCQVANNGRALLAGGEQGADYSGLLLASEVGELAIGRWIGPRALRMSDWKHWTRANFLSAIRN